MLEQIMFVETRPGEFSATLGGVFLGTLSLDELNKWLDSFEGDVSYVFPDGIVHDKRSK